MEIIKDTYNYFAKFFQDRIMCTCTRYVHVPGYLETYASRQ